MPVKTKQKHTVLLPADLDEPALSRFYQELNGILRGRPQGIAIDCSLLEHATSSHVNALWECLTRCGDLGISLKVVGVGYGLERVLKVLDLYDLFVIEPDRIDVAGVADQLKPPASSSRDLRIEIDPAIDDVNSALLRFHDFLKKSGVSGTCRFDLETVFYEVATNIVRHGGLPDDEPVVFSAAVGEDRILLRFTDSGEAFDPTGNTPIFDPREAIQNRQRRGIGLTMVRRLVDRMSYDRVNNSFNVVTLTKKTLQGRR